MKIDVCFTPAEVVPSDLGNQVVVVIDVLRATSTIVEALANGARMVVPASGIDDAVRIAQAVGRDNALLCGERRSLPIEGFDLGNSPREMTRERVEGRSLIMTTTNGTAALLAGAGGRRTLVGSFLNLSAVADELAQDGGPVTILCSGREKRFALEDAICAGALVRAVAARTKGPVERNDAALAAEMLAELRPGSLEEVLRNTAAGRQLAEAELDGDITLCASVDRYGIVPHYRDRQITL